VFVINFFDRNITKYDSKLIAEMEQILFDFC